MVFMIKIIVSQFPICLLLNVNQNCTNKSPSDEYIVNVILFLMLLLHDIVKEISSYKFVNPCSHYCLFSIEP